MEKKLRFGDLVRNAGRPKVLTLWTKPEQDRALSSAIKKNRVVTLIQEPNKKDHGLIGLHQARNALYLIFPRPLPREPTARIIGINYQLIEEPDLKPRLRKPEPKPASEWEAPKLSAGRPAPTLAGGLQKPKPAPHGEPHINRTDRHSGKPGRPKPLTRKFRVNVRRTASVEKELTVEAPSKKAAERQAVAAVQNEPFALDEADLGTEVLKSAGA